MRVYKLKHIPTGLFYKPKMGRFKSDSTNLSPTGKIYTRPQDAKPSRMLINVNDSQISKFNLKPDTRYTWGNILETKEEDWKTIEFDLVEVPDKLGNC